MAIRVTQLIECESKISVGDIPVYRDIESGYLCFPSPSKKDLESYYNSKYFSDPNKGYNFEHHYNNLSLLTERSNLLLSLCSEFLGRDIIDAIELGCAFGAMVDTLSAKGINVKGFDINSVAIEHGKKRNPTAQLEAANSRETLKLLTKNEDLVYSFHTMEHDPDMLPFFSELSTHLGKETLFFFTVPNSMYYPSLLKGFYAHYWAGYPDHLHLISPGFILSLCKLSKTVPLWWNSTNALNLDPNGFRHMCEKLNVKDSFSNLDKITCMLGYGLEISCLLVKEDSNVATNNQAKVAFNINHLTQLRNQEIDIRNFFEKR